MSRQNILVVTATDTDVGKTVFASCLVAALEASYWKPVQAGTEDGGDSATVARLSGASARRILPEGYRLHTPCSPHLAAKLDGVTIEPDVLRLPVLKGPLVIEGAGGALVPLRDNLLLADLLSDWAVPVVVVARTSLGTINHSLLTIEALRCRNVPILGVAFNGDGNEESEAAIVRFGCVRRLGRLPKIETLDRVTLARAFAAAFDPKDFM